MSRIETGDSTSERVTVGAKVPPETQQELATIAHEHSSPMVTVTISDVLRYTITDYLDDKDVEAATE